MSAQDRRWTIAGALTAALSVPTAGLLFLMSIFSANACGMFGDGCDDYGKPAPEFPFFAVGAVVVLGIGFAGLIVALVSHSRRSDQTPQTNR